MMGAYGRSLSRRQRAWLVATLLAMAVLLAAGLAWRPAAPPASSPAGVETGLTLREAASRLGMTPRALARELGLPLGAPRGEPLVALGVDAARLAAVVVHARSHGPRPFKYFVFAALCLWGLAFLARLGRPDGLGPGEGRLGYPRAGHGIALVVAVALAGFALGKSPNPMEGAVKVFKAMAGLYAAVTPKLAALAFFLALAVVGNKLVCGWACPFGALQELLFSASPLRGRRTRRLPFVLANALRVALFVAMLGLLFGVVGGRKGFVLYHGINPFNLFALDFDSRTALAAVILVLLASLWVFRPFCQLVCPFGLLSWLAERLSLFRVRVDAERCDRCGACWRACPVEAARGIVEGRLFAPDCFSCGRCLSACPRDALRYAWRHSKVRRSETRHGRGEECRPPEGDRKAQGGPP